MSRLEHAAEVADLAADLGLGGATNPVEAVLAHCRTRIDRWVAEAGGVTGVGQLEALVTRRLQMVFEEVRSDADFDRITQQYARAKKDPVFATLRFRFDDPENPTYGALVRRNVGDDAPDRFVAVIDCWELGARHGEAEGLRFLAVYRRSFEEYARYACELLE
ncbi:MAG: hypothetical protein ACKODX_10245, partial [Gemmata sp.]